MDPKSNAFALISREDTGRRAGHMKSKTEVGDTLPHVEECQEPPEAERGKKERSPRACRGRVA